MPTADDLLGFGVPAQLATDLGNTPSQLACTGTASTTAATVLTTNVELIPSSANTGAILPAAAKVGTPYYFFNAQSTGALIYPSAGEALNSSTTVPLTLAQNKAAILFQYKSPLGVGAWFSILTA